MIAEYVSEDWKRMPIHGWLAETLYVAIERATEKEATMTKTYVLQQDFILHRKLFLILLTAILKQLVNGIPALHRICFVPRFWMVDFKPQTTRAAVHG